MAILASKNSLFIFQGDHYVSLDLIARKIDDQQNNIPMSFNIPYSTIDAALRWDDEIVFFFKGMDCIKYDLTKKSVVPGYPKKIIFEWKGIWPSDLSDAIKICDKVFFFRRLQYISYDILLGKPDTGYPKSITDGWPGVWDNIDGAEYLGQGKVLFLKEDQVIQYDLEHKQTEGGYPQNIHSYLQSYRLNNAPNDSNHDMQTIRDYALAVTTARAKILSSYLSAIHNFNNTIQGSSSSEANPNTLSVVLKAGLATTKQLLVPSGVSSRMCFVGAAQRRLAWSIQRDARAYCRRPQRHQSDPEPAEVRQNCCPPMPVGTRC